MKTIKCQASGKIILSGEYAVVFGYPGIAVPCSCLGHTTRAIPSPFTVTATWDPSHSLAPARFTLSPKERGTKNHDTPSISHSGIDNETYLLRILDEIQKYTGPLHGHLTTENHIPIGRGMGSSTALVIAIVRAIVGNKKNIALSIEDTVNPGHSGLDFAVIWNEKPILFQKGKPPKILDITINRLMGTFASSVLIDTGKPNETTPEMVRWVKEKVCHTSTTLTMTQQALETIAHCTERLLTVSRETCHPERSRGALYEIFRDHHRAQITLGVVPEPVQALIADIEKIGGVAKVVGAGGRTCGGGLVLAIHGHPKKLLKTAQEHRLPLFNLEPST